MKNGFLRAVAASPRVNVADVDFNTAEIEKTIHTCAGGADLLVFPEMCVTAYTCGDLFHNSALLDAAEGAVDRIARASKGYRCLIIIGVPLRSTDGVLYNTAVAISNGEIAGVVAKTFLPNYNEFYEKRWFRESGDPCGTAFDICGKTIEGGANRVFALGNGEANIGVEICEDLWAPIPPSCHQALGGADVIVNLSASNDLIGKYSYLRSLILQQSARCLAGYVYASAGFGESTTDLVFDGKCFIAENGTMLSESKRWGGPQTVCADIDIAALRRERMHNNTFDDCRRANAAHFTMTAKVAETQPEANLPGLLRKVDPTPFVPSDKAHLAERCEEILNIQSAGLERRLSFTHSRSLVVGISGGLDSTLALLVAVRAFDNLGLPREGIIGVTMPGFGTTDRTYTNAIKMMEKLGVTIREIPIGPAVMQHFKDIGHNPEVRDVTYENSQARERTQILMDIANQAGAMVLGTGDLSELALGWATYNGDHMSMYGVNASVPKTLVRHLVKYYADEMADEEAKATLYDVVDTPISPELIPADNQGNITQKTEDLVGPYELHDFFLYELLRHGNSPRRTYMLAQAAFDGKFDNATILKWLEVFYRRFFAQQFKRSCLPDGPKVGSVTLSPRGDWRMPSDASSALWLKEINELKGNN